MDPQAQGDGHDPAPFPYVRGEGMGERGGEEEEKDVYVNQREEEIMKKMKVPSLKKRKKEKKTQRGIERVRATHIESSPISPHFLHLRMCFHFPSHIPCLHYNPHSQNKYTNHKRPWRQART